MVWHLGIEAFWEGLVDVTGLGILHGGSEVVRGRHACASSRGALCRLPEGQGLGAADQDLRVALHASLLEQSTCIQAGRPYWICNEIKNLDADQHLHVALPP